MDGLLSFLLFAGELHVDWPHLTRQVCIVACPVGHAVLARFGPCTGTLGIFGGRKSHLWAYCSLAGMYQNEVKLVPAQRRPRSAAVIDIRPSKLGPSVTHRLPVKPLANTIPLKTRNNFRTATMVFSLPLRIRIAVTWHGVARATLNGPTNLQKQPIPGASDFLNDLFT